MLIWALTFLQLAVAEESVDLRSSPVSSVGSQPRTTAIRVQSGPSRGGGVVQPGDLRPELQSYYEL